MTTADEVALRVAALPCPHRSWCYDSKQWPAPRSGATCSYCTAVRDVLDILQPYREAP